MVILSRAMMSLCSSYYCIYCASLIEKDLAVCHPFWSAEVMCRACCVQRIPCITCERRHGPVLAARDTTKSPVPLCNRCASLGFVTSFTSLNKLVQDALRVLTEATGLPFKKLQNAKLRVRLGTLDQLKEVEAAMITDTSRATKRHLGTSSACTTTTFGLCWRQQDATDILVLNLLSPLLVGAFLCHELMHALLFASRARFSTTECTSPVLPHPVSSVLLEEGLCHLAAACWLTVQAAGTFKAAERNTSFSSPGTFKHSPAFYDQIHFWLNKFFYSQHPEFAIGFHAARRIVQTAGWITAFHLLI